MSETTETLLRKLAASNAQLDAFHDRQNARLMVCIRTLAGIEDCSMVKLICGKPSRKSRCISMRATMHFGRLTIRYRRQYERTNY